MTPKQERFANAIIAGVNPSEAYRMAYSCENMSAASIATAAKKLLQNTHIAPIVEKARTEAAENAKWSCEMACDRLFAINTMSYLEIQKTGLKTAHNASRAFFASLDRLNKLLGIPDVGIGGLEEDEWDDLSRSIWEEAQKLSEAREAAFNETA